MNAGTEFATKKRTYTLWFDNRAYRLAEKEIGKPINALQDSIGDLSALLLAGLLRHHPDATIETVDDIVDELGYEAVAEALGEAIKQSPPLRRRIPQG